MGAPEIAALATALLGCVYDVKSSRIPNVLTLGATAAALIFHLIRGGPLAAEASLAGFGVALLLFLPFFALGGMGGGDVKLLAALGAWLGPRDAFWVAIWTSLAGGGMAVVVALSSSYLTRALSNLWMLAGHWRQSGFTPHPQLNLDSAGTPRLPYALPIAAGLVVTLCLR